MKRIGYVLLFMLLGFALLCSVFLVDPLTITTINTPPCWTHPFGTDELGRDLLSRSCHGLRLCLLFGAAAATLDLVVGLFMGLTAGWFGGWSDRLLMRFMDILSSIPSVLIALIAVSVWGSSMSVILFSIVLTGWINLARVVRMQTLSLRTLGCIESARAIGNSRRRILTLYILPQLWPAARQMMLLAIPLAIFHEAFLSFLGLGLQPPASSLGALARDGLSALRYYPWRFFCPATLLFLVLLPFQLMQDAKNK